MESKIQKEFVDTGFGFPIRLLNVPMVKARGVWTPKINYNELARVALKALSHKPARLTGSEIYFIRNHFEMTLQEFAKRFCVTHVAVLKWEKTKHQLTAMTWTTEKDIRLFILSKLNPQPQAVVDLYAQLERPPEKKSAPFELDVEDIAA